MDAHFEYNSLTRVYHMCELERLRISVSLTCQEYVVKAISNSFIMTLVKRNYVSSHSLFH